MPKYLLPSRAKAFEGLSRPQRSVARRLRRHGYAIIDFPDEEIEGISDSLVADLSEFFELSKNENDRIMVKSGRVQNHNHHLVKRIAGNNDIRSILGAVYGRRCIPFQTLNFPVGTQQPLHTDSVHFSCLPAGFMCGVWVALENITLEDGPLAFVPGSHRFPELQNHDITLDQEQLKNFTSKPSQKQFEEVWREMVTQAGLKEEYFLAKKGQALVWASGLLHGGSRRTNLARTRWSQVTHYYFEGCGYYTPLLSNWLTGKIAYRNGVKDISQ